jgi:ankyrin repeat protein
LPAAGVVRLLLEAGVDPMQKGNCGVSPLMMTANQGNPR